MERGLWLMAVSLHLMAAVSWVGGMLFLSFVLAPLVRNGSISGAPGWFGVVASRFRRLVWTAIAILLVTGPVLVRERGIPLFEPRQWPHGLSLKLLLVALLLLLTVAHDLVSGHLVNRIHAQPPPERASGERGLLGIARWLPRLAVIVAIFVLVAAAGLARS